MFEGRYGKGLTIALIALIAIVVITLAVFAIRYAMISADKASATKAAEEFNVSVEKDNTEKNNNKIENTVVNETSPDINVQINDIVTPTTANQSGSSNSGTKMYNGFPMVGTISIPKIDLNIPVLADASSSAINVSVAVNGGPGLNKVGNTIIIGHHYKGDSRFFGNLSNVANGDKIYITDLTGTKIEYIVYNVYTTAPEDSDFMDRPTNGAREITLETCENDSQSRLVVWAKEK